MRGVPARTTAASKEAAGKQAAGGKASPARRQTAARGTTTRRAAAGRPDAAQGGGRSLVIVESPAKARTIAGYLGQGYVVESSIGHIRDMPDKAAEIPARYRK